MFRWLAMFVAVIVVSGISGCGPGGPKTYKVTGEVTLSGEPLQEGEILFRAADGASASAGGKITAGRYEVQATEGAKRVEITAYKKVDTSAADSGEPAFSMQPLVPERYNTQSDLKANVTPQGPNEFNYPLDP